MSAAHSTTHLLLIDPQHDFCDIPGAALPVPGADADLQRVAQLLTQHDARFAQIHVTLDSHNPLDIAHPAWWCNGAGALPSPFTQISVDDVASGIWRARDPARQAQSLAYVTTLAVRGHYPLIIWPEHCLLGSWGHTVHSCLFAALNAWARTAMKTVHYQFKGINEATEHYSAIQAEVPDPADSRTLPDAAWLAQLTQADQIVVAGQALSHCVASTVRDLADYLGPEQTHKLVLLTDCTSPVAGFAAQAERFIQELTARGMRTAQSSSLFDALT